MAEAIRKGRLAFLEQFAKLFATLLGLLGVVSGCNSVMEALPSYGPPVGLQVCGQIHSAEDSSLIRGIDVRLVSLDSLTEYSFYQVLYHDVYSVWLHYDDSPWPDSVRLIASDPDSLHYGWFMEKDTLLSISPLQEEDDFLMIQLDLYLENKEQGSDG